MSCCSVLWNCCKKPLLELHLFPIRRKGQAQAPSAALGCSEWGPCKEPITDCKWIAPGWGTRLPVGRHTANKNGLVGNHLISWLLLPSFSDGSWCFKSFRIQLWSGNEFSCLKSSCLKQLCSFFSLSGAWNQLLIERYKCTILWFWAGFFFFSFI